MFYLLRVKPSLSKLFSRGRKINSGRLEKNQKHTITTMEMYLKIMSPQ